MSMLRIIIVAHDFPYPPNHGGKVDMWNRIKALAKNGVKIFLITWSDRKISGDEKKELLKYVIDFIALPRSTSPLVMLHPNFPSFVAARLIKGSSYKKIVSRLQIFHPNIVLLDGIAGTPCARNLANFFKIPLAYRSHNVEYEYARELYKAEKNWLYKLARFLNINKTLLLERQIRCCSDLTFDISEPDNNYWIGEKSMKEAIVIPPLMEFDMNHYIDNKFLQCDIDVLFVGNLFTPNNIYGLQWFLEKVSVKLENTSIVFAGAKPRQDLVELCKKYSVKIIADPREVTPLYRKAKVLINPIWHGSGINIKMIEMLYTGKPIVSTAIGVRGLNDNVLQFISVADDPLLFKEAILRNLSSTSSSEQIENTRNAFSYKNVDKLIASLNACVVETKERNY